MRLVLVEHHLKGLPKISQRQSACDERLYYLVYLHVGLPALGSPQRPLVVDLSQSLQLLLKLFLAFHNSFEIVLNSFPGIRPICPSD